MGMGIPIWPYIWQLIAGRRRLVKEVTGCLPIKWKLFYCCPHSWSSSWLVDEKDNWYLLGFLFSDRMVSQAKEFALKHDGQWFYIVLFNENWRNVSRPDSKQKKISPKSGSGWTEVVLLNHLNVIPIWVCAKQSESYTSMKESLLIFLKLIKN